MEGAYLLATLSAAMFIGSYLAGSIPLAFSFSQNRIRLFSIFGAGLLVGTALSVIIPEGVESLYGAKMEHLRKTEAGAAVLEKNVNAGGGDGPPRVIPQDAVLNQNLHVAMGNQENTNIRGKRDEEMADFPAAPSQRKLLQIVPLLGNRNAPDKIAMLKLSAEHEKREDDGTGHARSANEHDHEHEHGQNVHKAIGLSLIIGFIVMLIIDQATRSATFKAGERPKFKMTATIGLVVHAAADGVAMGSASATNRTDVQFIVFLAIMLHKAPAAFGLVSFLLVEGLERFRVRRHLFVFSMAAPATALLTFYAIVAIGSESLSSGYSTGILMLFSAGTFLYVATVHVLPELVNSSAGADYQLVSQASNTSCSSPGHSHSGGGPSFTIKELGTIIIGAILPAILASGHSH